MDYVIQLPDRELFKRCRRAWDFGARTRRNLEPSARPAGVEAGQVIDRALREALAVYYFPGMWDWQPAIVVPLVHQAYDRSVREQTAGRELTARQEEAVRGGRRLLERYAAWASSVDRFAPVRVASDVDVQVPDPRAPENGLVTTDRRAIRYLDRVDVLVIDEHNAYWVLSHRVVAGDWPETEALLLDEQAVAWCWAWELFYPGMQVLGTIYNELRIGGAEAAGQDHAGPGGAGSGGSEPRMPGGLPPGMPAARSAVTQHRQAYAPPTQAHQPPPGSPRISQRSDGPFRRTQIRRARAELAGFGARLALEAADMTDPGLPLYPNPSPVNCAACAYQAPCIAVNEGTGAEEVLAGSYRVRPPPPVEEGRLGGNTWSFGRGAAPPRFGREGGDG